MPRIFVITGPSGAGKTAVAERLRAERPSLRKVVTCTTRPPRPGEHDGIDYHFLAAEAFERLIADGRMFEWARVYDRFYGSRQADVDALLAAGSDVLFVVDVQGARNIAENHPEAVVLFLDAESDDELAARLEGRDQGTTANLEERRRAVADERAFGDACAARVVNRRGALDETVRQVGAIMDAAR